jgi:Flp pilus assembly protein TadB
MEAVREVLRARGRRLVTRVPRYTDDEVKGMAERAREPLLGMAAIVLAFLLPPAIVAAVFLILGSGPAALGVAVIGAALPPVILIALTYRRSRRRSTILNELSKFQESLRFAP